MILQLWEKRRSPELWLLASNLFSRLLGFWVSMLVSRMAGVQSLGVYSGLLITSASPTSPMASVLGNNATMMAAQSQGHVSLGSLVRAHSSVLLISGAVAWLGCLALSNLSGLSAGPHMSWASWGGVVTGLVLGQLITPFAMGVVHGLNLSFIGAGITLAVTVVALLASYGVVMHFGLVGALLQTVLVGLLPAVLVLVMLRHQRGRGGADVPVSAGSFAMASLRARARQQFVDALPSVGATVLNNATNWLACIYLTERFHGPSGMGLVAIGLQWMALMLLPLTSWSGRVMRALTLAQAGGQAALRQEVMAQIRRCVVVSFAVAVVVAMASPWIAQIYRADEHFLTELMVINAVGAVLFAVHFVYERLCFCLGIQRVWLLSSVVAYGCQLAVTMVLIERGVWAVALGNVCALLVSTTVFTVYLSRHWNWRDQEQGA